jgi:hypothetical protein
MPCLSRAAIEGGKAMKQGHGNTTRTFFDGRPVEVRIGGAKMELILKGKQAARPFLSSNMKT